MDVQPVERDGKADAVGMHVIGLRSDVLDVLRVLQPVRCAVQRRPDEPSADEGGERNERGDRSEARHHRIRPVTRR